MPRPASRRPLPIVLPNSPMDTLWEVDESADDLNRQTVFASSSRTSTSWFAVSPGPLHSVFEDDDDLRFPLPPVSLPHPKRFVSAPRMTLPIHPAPRQTSSASRDRSMLRISPRKSSLSPAFPRESSLSPKYSGLSPRSASLPFPRGRVPSPQALSAPPVPPRRQRIDAPRSVSPTSSASSSDNELPRTPPANTTSLPAPTRKPYVLAPPPPAEWEIAIDALFASADDEDVISVPCSPVTPVPARSPIPVPARSPIPVPTRSPIPVPTRRPPPVPSTRTPPPESYLSYSPVSSPSTSPRRSSMLPMSPTFARALGSPGFMPMSPSGSDSDHSCFSAWSAGPACMPSHSAWRREMGFVSEHSSIQLFMRS